MQLYPLRLLPDNINFDFIKFRNISYFISISLSILSIVWIILFKVNFGIDFAGGISIEAKTTDNLSEMRHVLNNLNLGEVVLQNLDNCVSIRIGAKKSSEKLMQDVEIIKSELNKRFNIEYRKIDFVGPQVGSQLVTSGLKALILSFATIMIYIWFRFEWQFGIGVLIALVHDAILALGFMSFTNLDFNLSTVAGILTIIGYSVNDSVVIYDRIRENLRKYRQKSINHIINISINETLSRTILTVVTTLIANSALIIFGGEAIRSFSLLVFCGIIAGTYSSIFISAPVLIFFKLEKFK